MSRADHVLVAALEPIYCRRCGRLLIGERARAIGFGPLCARGSRSDRERQELIAAGQTDLFDETPPEGWVAKD